MSKRSNADILRAAKTRIEDRRHYVMGTLAWDGDARDVEPDDDGAMRWSGRGAIASEMAGRRPPVKDQGFSHNPAPFRFLQQGAEQLIAERVIPPWPGICPYAGCCQQHEHMLTTLDAAIRLAEGAEAAP